MVTTCPFKVNVTSQGEIHHHFLKFLRVNVSEGIHRISRFIALSQTITNQTFHSEFKVSESYLSQPSNHKASNVASSKVVNSFHLELFSNRLVYIRNHSRTHWMLYILSFWENFLSSFMRIYLRLYFFLEQIYFNFFFTQCINLWIYQISFCRCISDNIIMFFFGVT